MSQKKWTSGLQGLYQARSQRNEEILDPLYSVVLERKKSTPVNGSFCTLKPKECTSSSTCTVSKFLVCRRTINPFLSTMIYIEGRSRTDTGIEAAHIAIPGWG